MKSCNYKRQEIKTHITKDVYMITPAQLSTLILSIFIPISIYGMHPASYNITINNETNYCVIAQFQRPDTGFQGPHIIIDLQEILNPQENVTIQLTTKNPRILFQIKNDEGIIIDQEEAILNQCAPEGSIIIMLEETPH